MGQRGAGADRQGRMTAGTAAAPGDAGAFPDKPLAVSTVSWVKDITFSAAAGGGGTMVLDGDSVAGQSPPEALLSALAACTAVDIVEILKKRRTPVERLTIRTTGRRARAMPPRFVAIVLAYEIDGAGITRDHAERAIDLAVNKYCTVKDSLATDIAFTWRLVLHGEVGADHDATAPAR